MRYRSQVIAALAKYDAVLTDSNIIEKHGKSMCVLIEFPKGKGRRVRVFTEATKQLLASGSVSVVEKFVQKFWCWKPRS